MLHLPTLVLSIHTYKYKVTKIESMKREMMMASAEYESPQMNVLLLEVERGFELSSDMDDMRENEGSWNY